MTAFQKTFQVSISQTGLRTYTSATRAAIVPGGRAVTLLTVNDNLRITDLNVKVNITHPRLSDLFIHLQGPDGTNVILFNRSGGTSANLTNTVFDDEGKTHIALGRGPYTGSYQPVAPLSIMDGKLTRGTWKLWVEDRGGVNRGTVNSWSLLLTGRAA
jgi:subtilisin-like proprotein convertase family protein